MNLLHLDPSFFQGSFFLLFQQFLVGQHYMSDWTQSRIDQLAISFLSLCLWLHIPQAHHYHIPKLVQHLAFPLNHLCRGFLQWIQEVFDWPDLLFVTQKLKSLIGRIYCLLLKSITLSFLRNYGPMWASLGLFFDIINSPLNLLTW